MYLCVYPVITFLLRLFDLLCVYCGLFVFWGLLCIDCVVILWRSAICVLDYALVVGCCG